MLSFIYVDDGRHTLIDGRTQIPNSVLDGPYQSNDWQLADRKPVL
jgi:hypothetical protein